MCGIIGVLNLTNTTPVDRDRLAVANDAQRHRGPDDEGLYLQADFGMAIRRLSIIDLARGHQPMSNEDGTLHIVYNGEVYNHEELRRELEARGHRFKTTADTEAVLHGYEEWGRDGLLERLRGMFAFAVWDSARRQLFLARDRMGIKPLYYAEYDGRLFFSSEIRPLLILSGMPRRIDVPAAGAYMKLGFVTAPHTAYQGIHKLPPAHCMWVQDEEINTREYWRLSYRVTHHGSEADIVAEFRERLDDCVTSHMMSEVPLGALLSGGVDSTATAAFMRRALKKPFKTVTIGFAGQSFDEMEWATASARELGTDHVNINFSGDAMDDFPETLRYLEEPTRAVHAAIYRLFRACRGQGLKVVLTGEGADELLGGYHWHQSGAVDRALSRLPLGLRRGLDAIPGARALGRAGRTLVRYARGLPTATHRRYLHMACTRGSHRMDSLLSPGVRSVRAETEGIFEEWERWLTHLGDQSDYEQILWIQSRTRLPDFIIHGVDRMSMAHSVEARPPFLDHTLWEFCASIPTGFKLRNATEKYLLREAGRGLIPEAARVRPKKPLQVPYTRWISQPRLPEWAEHALSPTQVAKTGLLDAGAVAELRRQVVAGDRSGTHMLMSALTLQTWAHMFIDSAPQS
jgi:asparagine synthase (glutamine-hydrolysing)